MLKTKFQVTVNAIGNHTDTMIRIIGNHNAGLTTVNLLTLVSYVKAKAAQYPSLQDGREFIKWEGDSTIHLCAKEGDDPYLTITECTYEELVMPETKQDSEILN